MALNIHKSFCACGNEMSSTALCCSDCLTKLNENLMRWCDIHDIEHKDEVCPLCAR